MSGRRFIVQTWAIAPFRLSPEGWERQGMHCPDAQLAGNERDETGGIRHVKRTSRQESSSSIAERDIRMAAGRIQRAER